MKVQVLRSAMEDLAAGRKFYDRQEAGVGDYFFDSLFAEIDSRVLYGGIQFISDFTGCWQSAFLTQFITR